jgi:transcription elongation factor GreA
MKENTITQTEYDFLTERIKELESSQKAVLKDLKHALNYGSETWHDNDMYDTAKNKQNEINNERKKIEQILKSSKIVGISSKPKSVVIGTVVSLRDLEQDEILNLYIGGSEAYRIGDDWISLDSPLGKYIKGKSQGDVITAKLPAKTTTYKIESVNIIDG